MCGIVEIGAFNQISEFLNGFQLNGTTNANVGLGH
jgi:hypothetical protein